MNYIKNTHCTENCTWFSDTVVPSIQGQRVSQQTTLAASNDTFDAAGRLTQVQETPSGEGCTTRIYAYDEETNRTSLTTRAPGTGGVCATEGGTVEAHGYDSGNRLTDTGIEYNTFGDTTVLPGADAGGTKLSSTFYVDDQLASQTQGTQTIGYNLDPERRTRLTVDTGPVTSTYISHYAGTGDSPAWTVEPTSGHWTRDVAGLSGLAAIETDTVESEAERAFSKMLMV